MVIKMYIEIFLVFNIYIDFLIILMTAILLKKRIQFKRLILSSIIGGLSSIFLFTKITIIELLIISFCISLIIIKIAFNQFKIIFYFYLNAIILGGTIFFINNYFNIKTSFNYLILIIITPIIVIIYKARIKDFKDNYNLKYQIKFKYQDQNLVLDSFLDTGNNLVDPYFHKPVILINDSLIKCDKYFYIPYSTIAETGIIKAFLIDKIEVIGYKTFDNIVIGLLPNKLKLNKIDCLLNNNMMEGYRA